ncbi:hypothetical protein D3C76_1332250 [compost metagenome]
MLGGFLKRFAHFDDFTDARTHLDSKVYREVPNVVGGKIAEHIVVFPSSGPGRHRPCTARAIARGAVRRSAGLKSGNPV